METYRVGLVTQFEGLTDAQRLTLIALLEERARGLPDDGRVELIVPGFDQKDPDASLPPSVNSLRYKHKVSMTAFAVDARSARSAEMIVRELCERLRCDEIWCCPSNELVACSPKRVARVWRLLKERQWLHVKLISPRVTPPEKIEPPQSKAKPKPKPGPLSYFDRQRKGARR